MVVNFEKEVNVLNFVNLTAGGISAREALFGGTELCFT